ncbi:aminodeoxychorismate synthase component I [Legionella waltersii]|uniref:aminodeoxychorismate synthase n=1 Tax=Legionella waltersii TaxID=66969 RepID=A0A0W1A1N2_9GAMM|nr:aminodeoxychorismate synthase component I [Legionella waltersii]KTD75040.1 para-aminobenzoate synthase component I [Legionella waltersii]SNV05412.1 para-aminobenzoate synthetase component I [Legionella waltersii]
MNNSIIHDVEYSSISFDVYESLSHLPGFILLQSTDTLNGRYDIVSAYPYDRLVMSNSERDAESVFKTLEGKLPIQKTQSGLPFQGGAMGYISYDLNRAMFGIQSLPQATLKDMPLLDLGFYDWALIVDHQFKKAHIFNANSHSSSGSIIQEIIALIKTPQKKNRTIQVQREFIPLMPKSRYQEAFNTIHSALRKGRSYQVNFTQAFHSNFIGDPWFIYRGVSEKNPVPFAAFMRTDHADVLSFSPERLLLGNEEHLLASPIKGTIHRSRNSSEDKKLMEKLLNCSKNRAENVMIVDLLRNDLSKLAKPGSVRVSNLCSIQSFNGVHHLVSDVHAESQEGIHPVQYFLSCFPGGSITGAPKLESMKIISEEESFARGVYCGSIGYFSNHGRFDMNIAIRTITAKNNVLHLAAGGGLVIDSNCEEEYRECFTKVTAIVNAINSIG